MVRAKKQASLISKGKLSQKSKLKSKLNKELSAIKQKVINRQKLDVRRAQAAIRADTINKKDSARVAFKKAEHIAGVLAVQKARSVKRKRR